MSDEALKKIKETQKQVRDLVASTQQRVFDELLSQLDEDAGMGLFDLTLVIPEGGQALDSELWFFKQRIGRFKHSWKTIDGGLRFEYRFIPERG